MPPRTCRALLLAGIASVTPLSASQPVGPLDLQEVLFRASRYVVAYQHELDGVAADEAYEQRTLNTSGEVTDTRTLTSSSVFVLVPTDGIWRSFRQVLSVDGEAVRRRGPTLVDLLTDPPSDAQEEVERLDQDGAEHHLGEVDRRLQLPLLPLMFLDPLYRHRFNFEKVGEEQVDGRTLWQVRFVEQVRPTLIQSSSGNSYAQGSLWIDTETGRVVRSELTMADVGTSVTATFQADPELGAWVPASVEESYQVRDGTVEGVLRYSNFERLPVSVTFDSPR